MLSTEERAALGKPVRMLQMIVIGLLMGVVGISIVVLLLGPGGAEGTRAPIRPHSARVLGYAALAVGIAALLGLPPLVRLLAASGRRSIARGSAPTLTASANRRSEGEPFMRSDKGLLFQLYFTRTIVSAALIEGAALVNLVACMQASWMPNLYVIFLLAVALAAQVPTMMRVETWLERQERLLQEDRRLGGS